MGNLWDSTLVANMDITDLNIGDRIKMVPLDGMDSLLANAKELGFGHVTGVGTIIDLLTEKEAVEQGHVTNGEGPVAIVDWGNGDLLNIYYLIPQEERGEVVNLRYLVKVESDA